MYSVIYNYKNNNLTVKFVANNIMKLEYSFKISFFFFSVSSVVYNEYDDDLTMDTNAFFW